MILTMCAVIWMVWAMFGCRAPVSESLIMHGKSTKADIYKTLLGILVMIICVAVQLIYLSIYPI